MTDLPAPTRPISCRQSVAPRRAVRPRRQQSTVSRSSFRRAMHRYGPILASSPIAAPGGRRFTADPLRIASGAIDEPGRGGLGARAFLAKRCTILQPPRAAHQGAFPVRQQRVHRGAGEREPRPRRRLVLRGGQRVGFAAAASPAEGNCHKSYIVLSAKRGTATLGPPCPPDGMDDGRRPPAPPDLGGTAGPAGRSRTDQPAIRPLRQGPADARSLRPPEAAATDGETP